MGIVCLQGISLLLILFQTVIIVTTIQHISQINIKSNEEYPSEDKIHGVFVF